MKNLILTLSLICLCAAASGQGVLLGPGDSYTLEFASLSYLRPASPTGTVWGLGVDFIGDSFMGGETVQVERFRDTLADTPVSDVFALSAPSGPNSISAFLFHRPNDQPFWTDMQGVVRVTCMTGSVRLDGVSVNEVIDGGLYGAYVAVPEPSTSSLLLLGCLTAWRLHRNRPMPWAQHFSL
jgi:hypothetical protein